jgi:hypothetical protein
LYAIVGAHRKQKNARMQQAYSYCTDRVYFMDRKLDSTTETSAGCVKKEMRFSHGKSRETKQRE